MDWVANNRQRSLLFLQSNDVNLYTIVSLNFC